MSSGEPWPSDFLLMFLLIVLTYVIFSGCSQMSGKERKKIEEKKVLSLGLKVSKFFLHHM